MKTTLKISRILILILLALAACVTLGNLSSNAYASTFDTGNESELAQKLNSVVKEHVEQNKFSGSVLVVKGDSVLLDAGYGYARRYLGWAQNTPNTKFLIGSMTKTFTALAILQLQEQGLVRVDDYVTDYFPEYSAWKGVTLHQLLTHTSGIPNYYESVPDIIGHFAAHNTPASIMAEEKETPLLFQPGTGYDYSNTNYIILTAIIEQVSGQSYIDYLDEHILGPVGMPNTGYEEHTGNVDGLAKGYCANMLVEVVGFNLSNFYGAGGLYSTTADLYQLSRHLDEQQLLNESNRVSITGAEITPEYFYGYGMMYYVDPVFGRTYFITGGGPGINTGMYALVDQDLVIILLTNNQEFDQEQLVNDLYAAYTGSN